MKPKIFATFRSKFSKTYRNRKGKLIAVVLLLFLFYFVLLVRANLGFAFLVKKSVGTKAHGLYCFKVCAIAYMYFWCQKYQKRGGFDSPAPLNDNGSALDLF